MSAPAYGTMHRGRIVRPDIVLDNYFVTISSAAPGRVIGPIQSAVRNLEPGDAVLLASIGTTRDDYVIVGRLPAFEPPALEIDDITGLQAALDDRATDAELQAAQDANNFNFLVVNSVNDAQDDRLDDLDDSVAALTAADTALDGRLDVVEPLVTANGAAITALQASDTAFATYSAHNAQHPVDAYGDQFYSFFREFCLNQRTLTNNGAFVFRTRARRALNVSFLRVMVVTTGTGAGSTTGFLYKGASQHGTYTLAASGAAALASLNEQNITLGSTPIAAGDWLLFGVRATGYTTFPKIATMLNAVQGNVANPSAARAAYLSRTTVGAMPATIDTSDGSWIFSDATPTWFALA
jgi:hypothetical protein